MATEISVDFTLTGRFKPNEITNLLGINPTNTWEFGDSIQNTASRRKYDGWKLSTANKSDDLNKQIQSIIIQLSPHASKLRAFCEKFNLESEVACCIYVDNDEIPEIHFNHEIIKKLVELNTEIDVDFYLL
jgi:hypothetical protein